MGDIRQGQDVIPSFRSKAEETQYLGHSGPGDPFLSCYLGLVPDLAGGELASPLNGLAEEFGYVGGLGTSWLFEIAPAQRNDAHDLVGAYPPGQDTHVTVINDSDWAEGD